MKIWLLTSEFPPIYGGGISTYCIETALMYGGFGHEVSIITQDFNVSNLSIIKEANYTVIRFNPTNYYTKAFLGYEAHLSFAFAETVKDCILKYGYPDVVESQEYMGIAYYLLQYKWLRYPEFKKLKIVVTLHAPSFLYFEYNKISYYKFPNFWIGEMEKFCIRAADAVISPSKYLVEELRSRMKLDDIFIHIIKNPYNIDWELPPRTILKNKIVFFGKLTPQKGCLNVIQYFQQMWKEGYSESLIMIGGGNHLYHPEGIDMIDYIRKQYNAELKGGKLKLLGSLHPNKINEHLDDAYIVVVPSIVDNLPYAVIEAMGRGKIVLASVQGGQSEIIIDKVTGFLFDHNDPSSFKNSINHIRSLSDSALKQLSENAFQEVKTTYSYNKIYKEKYNVLQNVLSENTEKFIFPFVTPIGIEIPTPFPVSELQEPLLSIVIPYYNMGEFISDTIASIINATHKNIEIIIVNDGSTENSSIKILTTFQHYPFLKIINKSNEGLALARNAGALEAKGDYLAFLDPDDTVEPTYYKKAIELLAYYKNVYFVGSWARYFGDTKGYWPAFNPEPPYLLVHNMVNSSALVYKKNAFLISGLNDKKMIYGMEDYESVIHLIKNGYQGIVLPEPLWNYRIRKNSMARAFTKEKQIYLYRLISDKHSGFYSIFASSIVNLLNSNGPGINYDNPTLTYNVPYNKWINLKFKQWLVKKVKANSAIRKIAIQMINFYNKK